MKKRLLLGVLSVLMTVTMMPGSLMEKVGVQEKVEAASLSDPRIVTDSSMTAGQKVTYDCVWYGSYPQTEIVDQASHCGTSEKPYGLNNDFIVNDSLYTSLQNASGWDSNGDITYLGKRYRRIKSDDATYVISEADTFYNWNSSDNWHYFRYEPIKWRVLDVNNNQLLLLADKTLDDQYYHKTSLDISWETSTIRSWLNGYGPSVNNYGEDYTENNFIDSAFNSSEKNNIVAYDLDNKTTGPYSEEYGGEDTTDKVFLLSSYDVFYSNISNSYGFSKDDSIYDEARRSRSTTYAKAMGAYTNSSDYLGNSCWRLRSPGNSSLKASHVHYTGGVIFNGFGVNYYMFSGIRPAIHLNVTSSDLSYAGTVCTDGTVKEESSQTVNTYTIRFDANGGSRAPANQIKIEGSDLSLTTGIPERSGFTFAGWSTDSNSDSASYSCGGVFTENENTTLYAIWVRNVTLSYDANGGSGAPASQTGKIYNNETNYEFTVSTAVPLRTDYTFLGWSTSATAKTASCNGGATISLDTDTTLYAVWVKNDSGEEPGGDDPVDPTPQPVTKKTQTITASAKTVPINNAAFDLGAKTSGDGKLTYKSSNTKAAVISSTGKITVKGYGTTTITITAPESSIYKKATKAVTITVVPKKMKLKSVKSPKKGQLQAKWVKDKQADGYQIQFSRDMGFKKGVYQKSISKKLTSLKKPVTGLDSKKKYYIRIRAIKKVSGKKLYGIWSYGKVVKIK